MKRRTQADWQNLIEQQAQSGLSVAEFCQQHNIGATYFYKRKSDLKQASAEKLPSKFIKVKPVASSNSSIY